MAIGDPRPRYVQQTITCEPELYAAIVQEAARSKRSWQDVWRDAVRVALDNRAVPGKGEGALGEH
jgi:hypothetical protein